MTNLETALLHDVEQLLGRWRLKYAGRPDLEREQIWLLALEREQIVAVAYREEAVAGRIESLDVDEGVRALIRQTLVWIWKDEELHEEYVRGLLLERGGLGASLIVYGRALQGAISGWVSSTENHLDARSAPLRTGTATLLVNVASALGEDPAGAETGTELPDLPALLRAEHRARGDGRARVPAADPAHFRQGGA